MEEFLKMPPVTRTLVGGVLLITGPILINVLSPHLVAFSLPAITKDFQIWRIPLNFLFGGTGIGLIFDLIMLYRNSDMLEQQHYQNRSYDYAWQLSFCAITLCLLDIPFRRSLLFRPLLTCIIYLTCSLDPNGTVNLYGLLSIQSKYFPYVMPAMDLLSGAGPLIAASTFTGIIVGHLWFMLEYQAPRRSSWGKAPAWLVGLFEQGAPGRTNANNADAPGGETTTGTAFGSATAPRGRTLGDRGQAPRTTGSNANSAPQHQWGSGRKLN